MRSYSLLSSMTLLLLPITAAHAEVFYATNFSQFSSSIDAANTSPGSTIYLAPGIYSGGALPNILTSLTIALDPSYGQPAGSAILNTSPTGQKGLLTVPDGVSAVNLTIDGLTFENAAIGAASGGNAAGIRYQGSGAASLMISNSTFLNNQDGILTGDGSAVTDQLLAITIANSFFANNGGADGLEHAIYAFGKSLDVQGTTFCGTVGGHDIKSRTASTTVADSNLYDGAQDLQDALCGIGSSSYAIDAPNGGQLTISGSQLIQGSASANHAIVSYGEEGMLFSTNAFIVNGDTFSSTVPGTGIQELANGTPTCLVPVTISNTTFSGSLTPVNPPSCGAAPPADPIDEPSTLWMLLAVLLGGVLMWKTSQASARPDLP